MSGRDVGVNASSAGGELVLVEITFLSQEADAANLKLQIRCEKTRNLGSTLTSKSQ